MVEAHEDPAKRYKFWQGLFFCLGCIFLIKYNHAQPIIYTEAINIFPYSTFVPLGQKVYFLSKQGRFSIFTRRWTILC